MKLIKPGGRGAQLKSLGKAVVSGALSVGLLLVAVEAAATVTAGAMPAAVPEKSLLLPVHGGTAEDLDDSGATVEARHIVEDLSKEKQIDEAWRSADAVGVENRTMRVFRIWVVHFRSAIDIGGNGTDLYIFMTQAGEFLKYSYDGR